MIAIALVASVAMAGIWYAFLFSPQSHSLKNAHAAAAAADTQAAGLRAQIATLQQEKAQLPATTPKLSTLKAALPDTPALDKLIDDINSAAADTGIDWQMIAPTKPSTFAAGSPQAVATGFPNGMQSVAVTMQVNGAYKQVTDFVNRLTTMSRLMDVTTVNLNGVGAAAPKTTAQLTTQIFYVPTAAAATPATAPATTPTTVKP